MEAGGSGAQGHLILHIEFVVSLGYLSNNPKPINQPPPPPTTTTKFLKSPKDTPQSEKVDVCPEVPRKKPALGGCDWARSRHFQMEKQGGGRRKASRHPGLGYCQVVQGS